MIAGVFCNKNCVSSIDYSNGEHEIEDRELKAERPIYSSSYVEGTRWSICANTSLMLKQDKLCQLLAYV